MSNPCVRCGACCAHFRVAFHWSETESFLGGPVPPEHTERLDPHRVVMRGTAGGRNLRCNQLQGEIGIAVHCGIYLQRPSPCRELQPDGQHGIGSPQCRAARSRHGLAPLTAADFHWDQPTDPQGPADLPRSA